MLRKKKFIIFKMAKRKINIYQGKSALDGSQFFFIELYNNEFKLMRYPTPAREDLLHFSLGHILDDFNETGIEFEGFTSIPNKFSSYNCESIPSELSDKLTEKYKDKITVK